MRNTSFLVILCCAASSYAGIAGNADPADPKLIAKGQGYAIHCFGGFVPQGRAERVVEPGLVISHTDLKSGRLRWLLVTGIHEAPTRRRSFYLTRLVGLAEDNERVVAAIYRFGRIYDQPPRGASPSKGRYCFEVYRKADGSMVYRHDLGPATDGPKEVPKETTSAGPIRKTETGFEVFGVAFTFGPGGEVAAERKGDNVKLEGE